MPNIFTIDADKREKTGKSANRQIRDKGAVPAIIYGKASDNHAITLNKKEVLKRYKQGGFFTQICEITLAGKKIQVLPKEISLHPVTDDIQHIDFLTLNSKEKVKIKVRTKFLNEEKCIGVKKGGVLNITSRQIELLCFPNDIVSEIEVDLLNLNISESIHVSDLELPKSVELSNKSYKQTIVTIVGRASEESENKVAESTEENKEEENKDK
jgi:large subunit ribosomal protein L25